jgi:hypothetical protein
VSRFTRALCCGVVLCAMPALLPAQPADSTAVLQALDRMLSAMRTKDADALRATFHDNARMTLLRPAPDGSTRVMVLTGEQFVTAATNPANPPLDEPIRHPVVRVDGNLATVWAEYQVRVAGKVSHCGYDAFHLVRVGTDWKILNVADTFRRTDCGGAW